MLTGKEMKIRTFKDQESRDGKLEVAQVAGSHS